MPAAIVILVHQAIAVYINNFIAAAAPGKHGLNACVATNAIWVAVFPVWVGSKRRINKTVPVVVHVYFINAGKCINNIQRILQRTFIVLKHRMIQCPFDNRPNVVATLPNNCIEVIFVYRPENNTKRHKQENRQDGNDQNYSSVNGRSELYIIVNQYLSCTVLAFTPEDHLLLVNR